MKASALITAAALSIVFTLLTGRSSFADSKSECASRLVADRARIKLDAAKHGEQSRQVEADLARMNSDRNWCRSHHADWDHACFDLGLEGVKGSDSSALSAASSLEQTHAGGRFEPASLVTSVQPEYPEMARRANVSGTVILRATVGKDGRISELEYIGGEPLLMMPALDAVKQWRYKPALLNCKAVEVSTTIAVFFTLAPVEESSAASH